MDSGSFESVHGGSLLDAIKSCHQILTLTTEHGTHASESEILSTSRAERRNVDAMESWRWIWMRWIPDLRPNIDPRSIAAGVLTAGIELLVGSGGFMLLRMRWDIQSMETGAQTESQEYDSRSEKTMRRPESDDIEILMANDYRRKLHILSFPFRPHCSHAPPLI